MKFCDNCKKEVRISKRDGICPKCGKLLNEEEAIIKYGVHTLKEKGYILSDNAKDFISLPRSVRGYEEGRYKVALCLSGQYRKGDIESIYRNIVLPLSADVFIVTNNFSGGREQSIDRLLTSLVKNKFDYVSLQIREDVQFLEIENLPIFGGINPWREDCIYSDFSEIQRIVQQMYYISEVSKARREWEKANNFKYDCVIRCRLDIIMKTKFYLPEEYSPNENTIYAGEKLNYYYDKSLLPTYDDILVFGPSNPMTIYMERFDHLYNLPENRTTCFSTETIAEYICKLFGIQFRKLSKTFNREYLTIGK